MRDLLPAFDPLAGANLTTSTPLRARVLSPTKRSQSHLERAIELHLIGNQVAAPEREFRFHPTRMWRFDFAWPARKLAVEVQGGIWTAGKHGRGAGIEKDAEKFNEAQLLGWVVLLITPAHIRSGLAVRWIQRALGA